MAFIRLNRKLFDHFLWTEKRVFSRAEAWIDLIQLVSYTNNNEKIIGGVKVVWERGQYPVSYLFLSQRWHWSVSKVRAFLKVLRNSNQINTQTTNVATMLTLCNYDIYNVIKQADEQADDIANDKQKASGRQEVKKIKKIEEERSLKEINNKENLQANLDLSKEEKKPIPQGAIAITNFDFLNEEDDE